MKKVVTRIKVPMVRKPDGTPFIWYNLERSRIEIVHGRKLTIIQLQKDTPLLFSNWRSKFKYNSDIPIKDMDGKTVASWLGANGKDTVDSFIIHHYGKTSCFTVPKGTLFQVQHETLNRPVYAS